MEKFAIGMLFGGMIGAVLCANNYKMRTLVKKGQEEVQTKLDQMMDEKIREMESEDEPKEEENTQTKENPIRKSTRKIAEKATE